jgi:hypothetical protein
MARVTYVVFVRDNTKGGEFVHTHADLPGQHDRVTEATRRKYPAPAYTVHTAYTLAELEGVTASIRRWTAQPAAALRLAKA